MDVTKVLRSIARDRYCTQQAFDRIVEQKRKRQPYADEIVRETYRQLPQTQELYKELAKCSTPKQCQRAFERWLDEVPVGEQFGRPVRQVFLTSVMERGLKAFQFHVGDQCDG